MGLMEDLHDALELKVLTSCSSYPSINGTYIRQPDLHNGHPRFRHNSSYSWVLEWTGSTWQIHWNNTCHCTWDEARDTWRFKDLSRTQGIFIQVLKRDSATPNRDKYKLDLHASIMDGMARDLKITLRDGSNIKAHSQLIRAACPGWELNDTKDELCIEDAEPSDVRAFVEALYTGQVSAETACGVARLADKYSATKAFLRCVDSVKPKLSFKHNIFNQALKLAKQLPKGKHRENLAKALFDAEQKKGMTWTFEEWRVRYDV